MRLNTLSIKNIIHGLPDRDGDSCGSWTLNTTTGLWTPPITKPIHENDPSVDEVPHYYEWDESAYQADNTKGWVLV